MAKAISEAAAGATPAIAKQVEIKQLRTMKNAAGNDVTVVDSTEVMDVDIAISNAEAQLASAEANVTALKADIVEYKKIKG